MKKHIAWLLIVPLMLLSSCGHQPKLSRLDTGDTVLAFGDSLTHGTGVASNEAYPAVLADIIGLKIINAGVPGEITGEGLKRLPSVLDEYRPSLVLLCLGGNDMLSKVDDKTIFSNLIAMIKQCKKHNAEVLLIGVPKPKLIGMKTAAFYYDVAQRTSVPLEDQVLARVLKSNKYKSDHIHPNAVGYAMMADAIAAKLRKCGAVKRLH